MKAWRLEKLGGRLALEDVPVPEPRPGSVLVRVEASTLMSYLKSYVEGKLPRYHPPPDSFTLGTNAIGTIEAAGRDVWQLAPGSASLSPHFPSRARTSTTPRKFLSASPRPVPRENARGLARWDARRIRARSDSTVDPARRFRDWTPRGSPPSAASSCPSAASCAGGSRRARRFRQRRDRAYGTAAVLLGSRWARRG